MKNPLEEQSIWITENDARDIICFLDYFLPLDPPHEDVKRIEELVNSLLAKLKLK